MPSLLQHRLYFQGVLSALQPRGSPASGSTALTINHQVHRGLSLSWSSLGEECRKGEGAQPSAGVILDALSLLPQATPQLVLPELGRASGLEMFRGCGLWKEARPAGWEARRRQALPQWGQDTGRSLTLKALLFASTKTPLATSLTLRSPH